VLPAVSGGYTGLAVSMISEASPRRRWGALVLQIADLSRPSFDEPNQHAHSKISRARGRLKDLREPLSFDDFDPAIGNCDAKNWSDFAGRRGVSERGDLYRFAGTTCTHLGHPCSGNKPSVRIPTNPARGRP
jgi:hypothetical protein